jgi:hypothetical protein
MTKFSVKRFKIDFSFARCNPRVLCSNRGIGCVDAVTDRTVLLVTLCSERLINTKFYENPFRGPGTVTSCRTTRRTDIRTW